jgi:hypothetical protein
VITQPQGKISGALPSAPANDYQGLVHEVIFNPDPSATGIVYIQQGGLTIKAFNKPATSGPLDPPLCLKYEGGGDLLNPTAYSIVPQNAGDGCFVTYIEY